MMAGLCFTLASPIAWGHHFGVVMPILAVVFLELLLHADMSRYRALLLVWGACTLLFSVDWNITDLLAGTALTFMQSWRLLAAIGLIWLMYDLQTNHWRIGSRPGQVAAPITARPARHIQAR
jgi:alpha-1,2-mannosyltransferase